MADSSYYEYKGLRLVYHETPNGWHLINIKRISDDHFVDQFGVERGPTNNYEWNEIIEAWRDRKSGVVAPEPTLCASCKRELPSDTDTDYQFDGALWIEFHGGYGMFIDNIDRKPPTLVICHACAHGLCEEYPWIDAVVRAHDGHSHSSRIDTVDKLLLNGHRGWDLDRWYLNNFEELYKHLQDAHDMRGVFGQQPHEWHILALWHYRDHEETHHKWDHKHTLSSLSDEGGVEGSVIKVETEPCP